MIKKLMKWTLESYEKIGYFYFKPLLFKEWKKPSYKNINERSIEFAFVFKYLSKICPKFILDVGSGKTSLPHIMANCGFNVTAIDKIEGYWRNGFSNRHYYILNDDITKTKIKGKFDLITCISVLEHIPNHKEAINGMFKLLKNGGYLILTFPFNEKIYIDNIYRLPDSGYGQNAPYICQVYSRREIDMWIKENPGRIIDQKYYDIFSGEFWTFGKRICPPHNVKKESKHQLTCIIIQKN